MICAASSTSCCCMRRCCLGLANVTRAGRGECQRGSPTKRAREVIKHMHQLGVARGDARAENMNYNFKQDSLVIYDFSHAKIRHALEDALFHRACQQDLATPERQIKWSMTDQGRAIRYLP